MNGQHINDSTPTIKANLATLGEVDANSVEMRVSGVGLVPANYEPKNKVVTYTFTEKLLPKTYTVVLSARVKGRKVETRWNFTVDREYETQIKYITSPPKRSGKSPQWFLRAAACRTTFLSPARHTA